MYNMLMPLYALTIDASQSLQIDIPCTIHELSNTRFSIELANVAMSRSTKLEYMCKPDAYQPRSKLQHSKRITQVQMFPLNDNTNNKYSRTCIYEIYTKGKLASIGHTYMTSEQQLEKHLQESKRNPSTRLHKTPATVNHKTDVTIKQVKEYFLQNRAQAKK